MQREKAALLQPIAASGFNDSQPTTTNQSSREEKIALFRSLFCGREDVYPRRFESVKTGKKGYQLACRNEWVKGICEKPKIRCEDCGQREFLPVTNLVIRNHLQGFDPQDRPGRDFTIGVYLMLPDETCWFLAVDFDALHQVQQRGHQFVLGFLFQVDVDVRHAVGRCFTTVRHIHLSKRIGSFIKHFLLSAAGRAGF